jgi:hypothetical protein
MAEDARERAGAMIGAIPRDAATIREQIEAAVRRVAAVEYTQPLVFAALAAAYVMSRAPFLSISYGTDPDAWRIALTGLWLWDHHEFYPSRLPGYPVPELASALVIKGGPLATNSLTLLVSLAGVWLFARIAKRLELPNRGLIVAGFAFTPLLWINSMTTMDYMWALTFILAAYDFLLRRGSTMAGIMLGLAVASRSTSILMLLPFVAYMWRDHRLGEVRPMVVAMIAVALAAWAPIYWKYELNFLNFYDSKVGYLAVLRLLAKDCLGLLGSTAMVVAVAISLPRLARLPQDVVRDKNVMVWILAIAVTALSFTRLPHEAAYLIPVYPFGLFIIAKYFRPAVLAGALAVIVFAGFIDLTSPGEEINVSALADARPGQGLLLSNRSTMQKQIDFAKDVRALDPPPSTVIATGFVYPILAVKYYDELAVELLERDEGAISQLSDKGKALDEDRLITYVWLLDYEQFKAYQSQGVTFWYTQDAGRSIAALYDYRLGLFGGTEVDLGRGPSGGSGAARTDR